MKLINGALLAMTLVFSERAQSDEHYITIKCYKCVDRGVIIMDSTPIMNCRDMKFINMFVGTGLEVGPISNLNRFNKKIMNAVKR